MANGRQGFWSRVVGDLSPVGKVWFYLMLVLMCAGGIYIGLWISCNVMAHPIDVPYVTADNYYENQEEMEAAAADITGEDGQLTVMLMGSDARAGDDASRSDTLMIAFVDMETPSVGLLSVPRDTYVEIDGAGMTKINHAFAYGGLPLTKRTTEDFLGIEIDRYLEVDFEGFAALVDAIGGVDINVEQDMYKPEEGINLQAGLQHLDGEDALAYCRWRGDGTGDIGRVERQQEFLKAVAEQMMSLGTIAKLPQMMDIISDNMLTDFTTRELLSVFDTFKNANSLELYTEMVPGTGEYINGVSYWIPDESQIESLVAKMEMSPTERAAAYPETQSGTGAQSGTGTTEAE